MKYIIRLFIFIFTIMTISFSFSRGNLPGTEVESANAGNGMTAIEKSSSGSNECPEMNETGENIITFDEPRYVDITWNKYYRSGPSSITDNVFGLIYQILYGEMQIVNSGVDDYMLRLSPYISSLTPPITDPQACLSITFNELQQYVKINIGTDCNPSGNITVSYYKNTDPIDAIYTKNISGDVNGFTADVQTLQTASK